LEFELYSLYVGKGVETTRSQSYSDLSKIGTPYLRLLVQLWHKCT